MVELSFSKKGTTKQRKPMLNAQNEKYINVPEQTDLSHTIT